MNIRFNLTLYYYKNTTLYNWKKCDWNKRYYGILHLFMSLMTICQFGYWEHFRWLYKCRIKTFFFKAGAHRACRLLFICDTWAVRLSNLQYGTVALGWPKSHCSEKAINPYIKHIQFTLTWKLPKALKAIDAKLYCWAYRRDNNSGELCFNHS